MVTLFGLLESEGLEVWEHAEGETFELGNAPFVSFFGDDETETKALKVAWAAGFYPCLVERERHFVGEQAEEPAAYTLWFSRDSQD